MTVPALYTRHQGVALKLASAYRIPGLEPEDVRQEARIALWIAARNWRPDGGAKFSTFAYTVVERRLVTLLRFATRERRAPGQLVALDDVEIAGGPDPERVVVDRERLARLLEHGPELARAEARRRSWRESKRRQRARAA